MRRSRLILLLTISSLIIVSGLMLGVKYILEEKEPFNAVSIESLIVGGVTVVATAHGFSSGDTVFIDHVRGTTELNGNAYAIESVSANQFRLSGTSGVVYSPWISGGTCYKYTSVVSGVTHLAGTTVQVLADGVVQSDKVVSSGATIALDTPAYLVHVGWPYTSPLQTVDIPSETGNTKKVDKVTARFFRTSFHCNRFLK